MSEWLSEDNTWPNVKMCKDFQCERKSINGFSRASNYRRLTSFQGICRKTKGVFYFVRRAGRTVS